MSKGKADEISLKDFINKILSISRYLKTKWLVILMGGILGGVLGLAYALISKPLYTASSTFVLDESNKGAGLSQYASLASMAGIDLGGSSSGGIFQSDNILELYKSRLMIEKALLSVANFDGKRQQLIERYIDFNHLRKKWLEDDRIGNISFNGNSDNFTRVQDSIITSIVKLFNKRLLTVSKPDKKISIIRVDVMNKDELFAREFNIKLVDNVNSFYSQTKTKKSYQSVRVLQYQADSVKDVLNRSINGVASAIDAAPNANPTLQILRVPSQRRQVDVQASTAIYGEIVKNLELSKMSLRQETPLIQLIDSPVLPLTVDKVTKVKGSAIGIIVGFFLTILTLFIRKVITKIMRND
ncbi:lipopolysaccharide biosynthesis protein [Mucilaginibacter sp. HC2]|uniref:lipopolysaccharide biosynthesis protein n=1 Tax=Mucilaginibacter inviolabilis TaxID=2714892 RepID=UPI00140A3F1F|nr:lipopolysaccharide biosynthesis protein [Mucilaginibacter inviolabilis]NHA04459.1 lipopolysaccharide biosynthesis protein [Mucilaginibacter inviolabilis]